MTRPHERLAPDLDAIGDKLIVRLRVPTAAYWSAESTEGVLVEWGTKTLKTKEGIDVPALVKLDPGGWIENPKFVDKVAAPRIGLTLIYFAGDQCLCEFRSDSIETHDAHKEVQQRLSAGTLWTNWGKALPEAMVGQVTCVVYRRWDWESGDAVGSWEKVSKE